MNPVEEAELDCILAGADYTKCNEASEQPGPSPELIGAVTTLTMDAVSAEGMPPHEGREGKCKSEVALARDLLFLSHSDSQMEMRNNKDSECYYYSLNLRFLSHSLLNCTLQA